MGTTVAVIMETWRTSIPWPFQATASEQRLVYQFKITLRETTPPVWRRIQVPDGTLDQLHEHIQTSMGWTNSHLHDFLIGDRRYGNPALLDEGGGDRDFLDSAEMRLSQLFTENSCGFGFYYEYDFGDCWRHKIVYEGRFSEAPHEQYPCCIAGARACPPEDCGGPLGYEDFLQAIHDPQHKDHDAMLEWIGGGFDPEKFSPAAATKAMNRGLPDWRASQLHRN
jgi:hypothetical protein